MRIQLLRYLVCPDCGGSLRSQICRQEEKEIIEGKLICTQCHLDFPIRNGVPRMLLNRDYNLKEKTQRSFAFSWEKFAHIYEDPDDFLDWIYPKDMNFFKDKIVLDAGCGTGKHALFASQFGAKEVIGFDLSNSVETAFRTTIFAENVHIIQADIYNLPLKEKFDFIYSIGVLHHLPESEKGFENLVKFLKEKGWLSIWVYGYEGTGFVRKVVDPIRKHITIKLPPRFVYYLSICLAAFFYFIARGIYRPLNNHKSTQKILKFFPMHNYLLYMSRFKFSHNFNSVFDQLIAPITHYLTENEVKNWFKKSNFRDIIVSNRNNMSWRGTGQYPS